MGAPQKETRNLIDDIMSWVFTVILFVCAGVIFFSNGMEPTGDDLVAFWGAVITGHIILQH